MTFRIFECDDCGLIHRTQMLNLVGDRDDSILGNNCPNCASNDVEERHYD